MFKTNGATSANRGHVKTPSDTNQERFSKQNLTGYWRDRQCRRCYSDYMKFSLEGYCQRCQQRVEYILRESKRQATSREVPR